MICRFGIRTVPEKVQADPEGVSTALVNVAVRVALLHGTVTVVGPQAPVTFDRRRVSLIDVVDPGTIATSQGPAVKAPHRGLGGGVIDGAVRAIDVDVTIAVLESVQLTPD